MSIPLGAHILGVEKSDCKIFKQNFCPADLMVMLITYVDIGVFLRGGGLFGGAITNLHMAPRQFQW